MLLPLAWYHQVRDSTPRRQNPCIAAGTGVRTRAGGTAASLEVLLEGKGADAGSQPHPIPAGGAKVDAGIDARVGILLRRLREAGEWAHELGKRRAARHGKGDLVVPEEAGEYLRGRTAQDAVGGRIVRNRGCVEERLPVRVGQGALVAVQVAGSNGRDWPPEVVEVAGFPTCDEAVRHGHIQQGKEPGTVPWVEVGGSRHNARDPVPTGDGTLVPEAGDGALLGAARGAGLIAEALDLIVVPRVLRTRQRRGTRRPELRGGSESERRHMAPSR